ncbi:hypothetical protein LSH36_545g04086 [Paralvinella palmiformis]|uniref:Late endosomal/lysosomal adaptor and MAPK and MTOR activator 5 n=1 Tax=Paralvinella palmiformis TaxID=53620 RepID=A0AAD9MXC1_9ANNE|nr:hypothetical protein LSH36_545g04086 [Paralvinella palmiformis]
MMEKSIEKLMDEIMTNPGVNGVVCTDAQGLVVAAQGVGRKSTGGQMTGVLDLARDLHPDVKDEPIVCIESDAGSLLLKSCDGITIGIHKTNS